MNRFEERLQQELLRLCTDYHVLDGTLLATEDLDNRWHDLAPEYVADALSLIHISEPTRPSKSSRMPSSA